MNRIILAYCQANADQPQQLDARLSRIGIPFEHVHSGNGHLADRIFSPKEPVLLLVTDNFLKDRACVEGLLDGLKSLPEDVPFLVVLADGKDENGQPVPTHIDRMVHMLHYMNYWQSEWLKLSSSYQSGKPEEKEALELSLDRTRAIANQMSDLITFFREKEAVPMEQLERNDYALFFGKFGLSDWHGQYKKIAGQNQDAAAPVVDLLPETPLTGGLLAPEPVEVAPVKAPEPVIEPIPEIPEPEPEQPTEPVAETQETAPADLVEIAIRDAHFWIERGHAERGIELLKTAAEEYPADQRVTAALRAVTGAGGGQEEPVAPPPAPEKNEPKAANNVHSYEMMGDMAESKGDYLFAKYCWDRVLELEPDQTGVYRKLGLMTAEHLHDYRETAIHYLEKALAEAPGDAELSQALAALKAEEHPVVIPEPEPPAPELPVQQPEIAAPEPEPTPGVVLITGATSGIGRATAQLLARHGYRLILTGRRVERLVELKNQLEDLYKADILLLPFDVRDAGAVEAALSNLPDSFRDIDVLVNNAGLAKGLSPIHEGSLDHWETMIDTNVKGLLYVTRMVSPGMVARKNGHIINVASSAGKEVYPNGNVYCATKFAVDALTKAMRYDLYTHNIRVSQVSPGHVEETEFAVTRFDGDVERARIYQDFQPLKAGDVAEVIYFMISRPAHVNIQDVQLFSTQQAASTMIHRSGRL